MRAWGEGGAWGRAQLTAGGSRAGRPDSSWTCRLTWKRVVVKVSATHLFLPNLRKEDRIFPFELEMMEGALMVATGAAGAVHRPTWVPRGVGGAFVPALHAGRRAPPLPTAGKRAPAHSHTPTLTTHGQASWRRSLWPLRAASAPRCRSCRARSRRSTWRSCAASSRCAQGPRACHWQPGHQGWQWAGWRGPGWWAAPTR